MRVILDTNVFVSGIFFGGPPYRIPKAWRGGELRLVVSQGRSWAIQDGILGGPWVSPKIYKPVGKLVGVNTFQGEEY